MASFSKTAPSELWVVFGVRTNFRYVAALEMVATMNTTTYLTLPILHAFTGCDFVSSFSGRGKKTAGKREKVFAGGEWRFQRASVHAMRD